MAKACAISPNRRFQKFHLPDCDAPLASSECHSRIWKGAWLGSRWSANLGAMPTISHDLLVAYKPSWSWRHVWRGFYRIREDRYLFGPRWRTTGHYLDNMWRHLLSSPGDELSNVYIWCLLTYLHDRTTTCNRQSCHAQLLRDRRSIARKDRAHLPAQALNSILAYTQVHWLEEYTAIHPTVFRPSRKDLHLQMLCGCFSVSQYLGGFSDQNLIVRVGVARKFIPCEMLSIFANRLHDDMRRLGVFIME